ncbi:shTK domain protein [Necator americanus]|uniref:ShTK domain protein n=1 Tax=Necator americanus TaxID=51031 RepID=W2T5F6_NECAM|nr:shTK domain protein [Necator americanus]ETN76819.1 shTK domain protein [Necator americanus]
MSLGFIALLPFLLQITQAQLKVCTDGGAGPCQDFVNPRTGQSDCPQMESYCRNALYMQLMREQCPKTCKYCN